jgi:hypothetical protein
MYVALQTNGDGGSSSSASRGGPNINRGGLTHRGGRPGTGPSNAGPSTVAAGAQSGDPNQMQQTIRGLRSKIAELEEEVNGMKQGFTEQINDVDQRWQKKFDLFKSGITKQLRLLTERADVKEQEEVKLVLVDEKDGVKEVGNVEDLLALASDGGGGSAKSGKKKGEGVRTDESYVAANCNVMKVSTFV